MERDGYGRREWSNSAGWNEGRGDVDAILQGRNWPVWMESCGGYLPSACVVVVKQVAYGTLASMDSLSDLVHCAIPLCAYHNYSMRQCGSEGLRICSVMSCTWKTSRVKCPDRNNRGKLVVAEWVSYGTMTT